MIYKVLITETQRMMVEMEASSPEEAEQWVQAQHWKEAYNLDESADREITYAAQGYSNETVSDCPNCGRRRFGKYCAGCGLEEE